MVQEPLGILSQVTREDLAPTKKKRKRVAMRTKGREKSKNIEDRRAYFGSDAIDNDYGDEDRYHDFLRDALRNPKPLTTRKDLL